MITGKTLIDWGFEPSPWFAHALTLAKELDSTGATPETIRDALRAAEPNHGSFALQNPVDIHFNIEAMNAAEQTNLDLVADAMGILATVPTVRGGAVMPDACPAGTIPVGGVVATENAIHPGFHSADICCSVAIAVLGKVDPKAVLDRAMEVTHFGGGGRPQDDQHMPSAGVLERARENRFLHAYLQLMVSHFATQGDGNHFLFVGQMKSTGDTAIVTHHGSRGPGARLFRVGMDEAERFRAKIAPEVPAGAAWIPADSEKGRDYWEALQIVKDWTRESHFKIHELTGFAIEDWFWNEHNFVFQRSDGLFYHAKGATPGWSDYDTTLVPLNMAEPVLLTRGADAAKGLGFLPHGAGRNMSRTRFLKENPVAPIPPGIDARFFSGRPDFSEFPAAYKDATTVRRQMVEFGLAEIVDEVVPYGCIMAGEQTQWWRK